MAIPKNSAYSALKDTDTMQGFIVSKCPFAHRNGKSLITCTEDGTLCYDNSRCSCKQEYKASASTLEYREKALKYLSLLQQTPEELKYKHKPLGTLLAIAPDFLTKQLIREGTFGEFNKYLKFLSLEIVNAYYSGYLTRKGNSSES